jgi:hypothetical protein
VHEVSVPTGCPPGLDADRSRGLGHNSFPWTLVPLA